MATVIQGPAPFININFWLTGPFWEDRGPSHVPRYHKGVDLATSSGNSPFYSIQTGVVIGKGHTSGYGHYLITRNPTTHEAFFYADMDEASSLNVGDPVTINQTRIGYEGAPGASTGGHVHIEEQILADGESYHIGAGARSYYQDPTVYIGIPNVEGGPYIYYGGYVPPTPPPPTPPTPTYEEKHKFPWFIYYNRWRRFGR